MIRSTSLEMLLKEAGLLIETGASGAGAGACPSCSRNTRARKAERGVLGPFRFSKAVRGVASGSKTIE